MKASIAAKILLTRTQTEEPQQTPVDPMERHYTPEQIAEQWQLDVTTIRRAFEDVPGVLKSGTCATRGANRKYVKLPIPESVLQRVYREMTR